jgi:hypothetical protein
MLTSVLQNLIDLAGSEKAAPDKERTREAKYVNTKSRMPLFFTESPH